MTCRELIEGSLRLLKVLGQGETAAPEEYAVCFEALNTLIDEWLTQHRFVFVIDHKQYPLVSGKASYTMGPGGDFDTERPVKIQSAGVVFFGDPADKLQGLRPPLQIINQAQWADIAEKSVKAKEPLKLYNDNAYPLLVLKVWPIPEC